MKNVGCSRGLEMALQLTLQGWVGPAFMDGAFFNWSRNEFIHPAQPARHVRNFSVPFSEGAGHGAGQSCPASLPAKPNNPVIFLVGTK